jgi:class II lanthipeptide synthase
MTRPPATGPTCETTTPPRLPRSGATAPPASRWGALRAAELLGDDICRADAQLALATTQRAVAAELASGAGNFSLCHGLAGNAEVLLEAVRHGADEDGRRDELVRTVADAGIEPHVRHAIPWPCGTFEGETTSLFLGLAGIGLFYLRLDDPGLDSVLLVEP